MNNWLSIIILGLCTVILGVSCNQDPYPQGAILYSNFCASCHMEDGSGLGKEIPPLANADYLKRYPDQLPCIIHQGISDSIQVNGVWYNQPMAGVKQLTVVEITNVINYINSSWGNDNPRVSLQEVQQQIEPCASATIR